MYSRDLQKQRTSTLGEPRTTSFIRRSIVITPRNYVFDLRNGSQLKSHYAMIGMACVMQAYPLYYDAVNEKGLGIAGLNFVGNASYRKPAGEKDNITQFELIPWLLGKCASVKEVQQALENLNRPTHRFPIICRLHSCTGSSQTETHALP